MMTPTSNRRLQLATRIHYALGQGIDVGRLLKQRLYARDVLLVCDACTGNDLQRLAKAFRGAMQEAIDAGASGSSTFGLSAFNGSQLSTPGDGWTESVPTA
jgi:hypothetical protein